MQYSEKQINHPRSTYQRIEKYMKSSKGIVKET